MTKECVHICFDCKEPERPVALMFGEVPGWACKCRWGTLTRKEYRLKFGFRFKRAVPENVATGGTYSGNSGQRRKQRRVMLQQLRAVQAEWRQRDVAS